jgi:apolipoprotein N-acyltransferase
VAAAASGVLLACSFPPLGWSLAGWLALVPLFYAIDGERPLRVFRLGWLAGLVFFALIFQWVPGTIDRTVSSGLLPSLGPLLLLSLVLGLYLGMFAVGLRFFESHVLRHGLIFAPVWWVALEWSRAEAILPCPWEILGYSQAENLTVVQIVDMTGIYGVSALIVAVNHVLYDAVARRAGWQTRLGIVAALCLAVHLYGVARMAEVAAERPERTVRIGLVQPAIDPHEKWDWTRLQAVMEVQEDLARQAVAGGAELAVWPEASAPFVFASNEFYSLDPERFAQDRRLREDLLDFVRALGRPLLLGSPALVRRDLGRGEVWRSLNRSLLIEPTAAVPTHYDKMILVPFGEYVPWRRVLFFVDKLVPGIGDFEPGTEAVLFPIGHARFAVLVCYEAIFPDFVRRFVDRGASLLVNQTNDAWFGDSAAPAQHLAMASIRAIENRTPLVRVANTGISAVVDPDGRARGEMPLGERGFRVVEVGIGGRASSFYTRHGDVFALAAALAAVLLLLYAGWMAPGPEPALVGAV